MKHVAGLLSQSVVVHSGALASRRECLRDGFAINSVEGEAVPNWSPAMRCNTGEAQGYSSAQWLRRPERVSYGLRRLGEREGPRETL